MLHMWTASVNVLLHLARERCSSYCMPSMIAGIETTRLLFGSRDKEHAAPLHSKYSYLVG
eukprot:5491735-Amphidinium_carterae.1